MVCYFSPNWWYADVPVAFGDCLSCTLLFLYLKIPTQIVLLQDIWLLKSHYYSNKLWLNNQINSATCSCQRRATITCDGSVSRDSSWKGSSFHHQWCMTSQLIVVKIICQLWWDTMSVALIKHTSLSIWQLYGPAEDDICPFYTGDDDKRIFDVKNNPFKFWWALLLSFPDRCIVYIYLFIHSWFCINIFSKNKIS